MGKIGRFACIFTPMALTIASLVCLVLVFCGQLSSKNALQRDLYFFKANMQDFTGSPDVDFPDVPNTELDNKLLAALQGANSNSNLKDFYQIGLWNYCEGDIDSNDKETITYCSPRKANFWFDPVEVWDLKNTTAGDVYPEELEKGLKTYRKVAGWMFTAYLVAGILTVAELVVGIFAIFSRWGSLVTTIVSMAQTIFIIAAAATSTAIYAALVSVFHTVMEPYNIDAQLGSKMLSVVWLAVAFSIGSGFFWMISICCCSGASPHKKVVVEKTPYTYERVASPYLGASANNQHMAPPAHIAGHGAPGNAYEPFRHQNASHV